MTTLVDHFSRAIAALEAQNIDVAKQARAAAVEAGTPPDHAGIRYLDFMFSWLDEALEPEDLDEVFANAEGLLDDGLALDDPEMAARIVLDLADVLLTVGVIDEAEHALRMLSERDDIDALSAGEARMLRAQLALDHQEDPEEALALLDGIDGELQTDPGYVSLRAAVLVALDRFDGALELLRMAIATTDDTELHYQCGVVLREMNDADAGLEHMLTVRRRDLETHKVKLDLPVSPDEADDLERRLEDVLETLPESVVRRVASAQVELERWPSEAAITEGCDPRTTLSFHGRPDVDGEGGHVDKIILYRDSIVAQIDDDDEIIDALALGLVEEFDRLFDLELIPGM